MTTEIKPARRRVTPSNDSIPLVLGDPEISFCRELPVRQRVTPSFAKWEAPATFLRVSPPEHRNIPFVEEKGYIYMDGFDKGVAIAIAFGAVVVLLVTAYELRWLQ